MRAGSQPGAPSVLAVLYERVESEMRDLLSKFSRDVRNGKASLDL